MSDKKLRRELAKARWSAFKLTAEDPAAKAPTHPLVAQTLHCQDGYEDVVHSWMKGLSANATAGIVAEPPQEGQLRVVLYAKPATGQVMPAWSPGDALPDLVFNGHALLAFTSPESAESAGFMYAAWLCAWMSPDAAREHLKNSRLVRAEPSASTDTAH